MLMMLTLLGSVAEIISLGSVVPFLAALTAPDRIMENSIAKRVAGVIGIFAPLDLVMPLATLFVLAALTSGALRVALLWANIRFANGLGCDLSIKLYRNILYRPYQFHLDFNSSDLLTLQSQKIGATTMSIQSVLNLLTALTLSVAIISALLVVDVLVATITSILLSGFYFFFAVRTRRFVSHNGVILVRESVAIVKALQESLGGIRDVLLGNCQEMFVGILANGVRITSKIQAENYIVGSIPRFVLEPVALLILVVISVSLVFSGRNMTEIFPLLGLLVFGAQRLLPVLQQCFQMLTVITANSAAVRHTLEILDYPLPDAALIPAPLPLVLKSDICLRGVSFGYGREKTLVLDGVDLYLPKGVRAGFVGKTGGGKTTALDLIMGLLVPLSGSVSVDGTEIANEHRRAWQRSIAHVPQNIFLSDVSLAENIAFGVERSAIQLALVREAAQGAQLSEFIESLPMQYWTVTGERGVRLSGGQRQRVGIARALYRRASVLVLDEATSALDNATEQAVMDSIGLLSRDLTILIIAHRVTTVQACDVIYEVTDGKICIVDAVRRMDLAIDAVA